MSREPDIDDARQSERTSTSEFELSQSSFQEDDHGLSAIRRGRHRGSVMHDYSAST
jgi:hypothetical protein